MDKFDRIFQLHTLLNGHRYPVSLKKIQAALECSERTARRAINQLRDALGAPSEHDHTANGYIYNGKAMFELPGLWFSDQQLYALLVSHRLLSQLQPSWLDGLIEPLQRRIEAVLTHKRAGDPRINHGYSEIWSRSRGPRTKGAAGGDCAIGAEDGECIWGWVRRPRFGRGGGG